MRTRFTLLWKGCYLLAYVAPAQLFLHADSHTPSLILLEPSQQEKTFKTLNKRAQEQEVLSKRCCCE